MMDIFSFNTKNLKFSETENLDSRFARILKFSETENLDSFNTKNLKEKYSDIDTKLYVISEIFESVENELLWLKNEIRLLKKQKEYFLWDGSDISELINNKNTIIKEGIYGETVYWNIFYNDKEGENREEICIVRTSTTNISCLIDEIKPIFGLEKLGTHWCQLYKKTYILIKPLIIDGILIQEISLHEIGYLKELEKEIQKIFVFRELLGITKSFEKNVVCRKERMQVKTLSFYEPNMMPFNENKVTPNTILDKWFNNTTIDEVMKDMFRIRKLEYLTSLLANLRKKMNYIVHRVDKNMVGQVDEILSRIRSRLQFILN
jgi:hypothetical protein